MFSLVDDGTLDTVVECSRCGQEIRFFSGTLVSDEEFDKLEPDYDALDELRITRAIEDAEWSHECEEDR